MLEGIDDFPKQKKEITEEQKLLFIKRMFDELKTAINSISIPAPVKDVDVGNLDEVRAGLHNELSALGRTLAVKLKPKEAVVMGIRVEEMADLIAKVDSLKQAISQVDFKPEIKIIDKIPEITIPEIKIPEIKVPKVIIPAPEVTVKPADVNIDLDNVIKALAPLKFISDKAGKPISVRLSDGVRFIQALKKMAETQEKQYMAFTSASGMTVDEYKTVSGVPKTFGSLRVDIPTSGTPIQVSVTAIPCCDVYLSADTDSGKVLVVGDSGVIATNGNKNGIILIPGNDVVHIRTNDLKNLWVDSQEDGGALCVSYSAL